MRPIGRSTMLAFIPPLPSKTAAGAKHTVVCQWCLDPFEAKVKLSGKLRNSVEYEPLRKALMIPHHIEPIICDSCYANVMRSTPSDETIKNPPRILAEVGDK